MGDYFKNLRWRSKTFDKENYLLKMPCSSIPTKVSCPSDCLGNCAATFKLGNLVGLNIIEFRILFIKSFFSATLTLTCSLLSSIRTALINLYLGAFSFGKIFRYTYRLDECWIFLFFCVEWPVLAKSFELLDSIAIIPNCILTLYSDCL